jgi:hypothetical protein
MGSVDGFISGHASGHGALVVLLLAFALGLRHASDPDHLVAVSTLVADTRGRAARAAARLGAAWGLGHATTLLAFGLPVLLVRSYLPHPHVHVHSHARGTAHAHDHAVRTPAKAFAIGLVHGTAGSAGVAVLLIAAIPSTALACVALVVLVAGCALSMALMSAAVGGALGAATARRRFARAIPALGSLALAFGAWYVVAALQSF